MTAMNVEGVAAPPPHRQPAVDPLWTVEDVATFLRVPVATQYDWRRTRRGPVARRVGKYLRYNPQDVRDWFNKLAH